MTPCRPSLTRSAFPRAVAGALAAAALLGCATVQTAPREDDERARTMPVPEGRALVYVYRDSFVAAMGLLPLYVNEEHVADLAVGTYCVADVPAGDVRVEFPFGVGATVLPLEVEAGRRYYVREVVSRSLLLDSAQLMPVSESEGATSLGKLIRVVSLGDREAESRAARARVPSPGSALVYVFRAQWWGAGLDFDVSVNGTRVGKVGARTFLVAEVPAGPVNLSVKSENDAMLSFDLAPGATVYVTMSWSMGWAAPRIRLFTAEDAEARQVLERLTLAPPSRP